LFNESAKKKKSMRHTKEGREDKKKERKKNWRKRQENRKYRKI